ncbi:MAG: hypothetical protein KAG66_08330, partial [Methylococcales bacterium]|nr:hypothetical protein [Methylococcales bacterium]
KIQKHFKQASKPLALKYIDPSYIIRSVPANSQDSLLCLALGQSAVHAGMAGKTNMVIGFWNQHCTHIPIALAVLKRKKVDPKGYLWQTVLGPMGVLNLLSPKIFRTSAGRWNNKSVERERHDGGRVVSNTQGVPSLRFRFGLLFCNLTLHPHIVTIQSPHLLHKHERRLNVQ